MTDMQAALGLCQLDALDGILDRRRWLAERYTAMLDEITFLAAPYDPPETKRTGQSYCVRLSAEAPLDRTE
ncbi:MAG: DegT/DnrJ/EryC1/StrS family aminotransferase [Solirubrobacteraceae bacterium]